MVDVLLVDPDDVFAGAMRSGLKAEGHQVYTAGGAQTAVDCLDEHGADIVITELQLPEHNGLALLQHLQSYVDWQQLPVIVLSQLQPQQVELSSDDWRQYGVADYIHKPKLDLSYLTQRIIELAHAAPAR